MNTSVEEIVIWWVKFGFSFIRTLKHFIKFDDKESTYSIPLFQGQLCKSARLSQTSLIFASMFFI